MLSPASCRNREGGHFDQLPRLAFRDRAAAPDSGAAKQRKQGPVSAMLELRQTHSGPRNAALKPTAERRKLHLRNLDAGKTHRPSDKADRGFATGVADLDR